MKSPRHLAPILLLLFAALAFGDSVAENTPHQTNENPISAILGFTVFLIIAIVLLFRKGQYKASIERQNQHMQKVEDLLERIAKAVERK